MLSRLGLLIANEVRNGNANNLSRWIEWLPGFDFDRERIDDGRVQAAISAGSTDRPFVIAVDANGDDFAIGTHRLPLESQFLSMDSSTGDSIGCCWVSVCRVGAGGCFIN